jgi:ParB family chromosome partitioning protein
LSAIRRMLTERTVRASDRRALFVGIDAYEQAGGIGMRDFFQQDDGRWLEDVGLLDALVTEKLKAVVKAAVDLPWSTSPVEGQINRLKMLKRTMYGRAGFQFLRQRVLQTT